MFFSTVDLADFALDLSREHGLPMRKAIGRIADSYEADPHDIAVELNRRSQLRRLRGGRVKKVRRNIKWEERFRELDLLDEARKRGDALAHERNLRRGFELADHLDDYE